MKREQQNYRQRNGQGRAPRILHTCPYLGVGEKELARVRLDTQFRFEHKRLYNEHEPTVPTMEPSHEEVFALERMELSDDSDDGFEYNVWIWTTAPAASTRTTTTTRWTRTRIWRRHWPLQRPAGSPAPTTRTLLPSRIRTAVRPSVVDDFIRTSSLPVR